MGVDCSCLVEGVAELQAEDQLSKQIEKLQQGSKFMRTMYLVTSQELYVRLSDDTSHLSWKTTKSWTGDEKGQVDLTDTSLTIKSSGPQGIQFALGSAPPVLELNAETQQVRDEWIVALNDLRAKWAQDAKRPASSISADGHSDKEEYFARRDAEIKARKAANDERKKKYSAGGMQHTAAIMMARGST